MTTMASTNDSWFQSSTDTMTSSTGRHTNLGMTSQHPPTSTEDLDPTTEWGGDGAFDDPGPVEQCANYLFAVSVILLSLLCIFGMVGNLISLAVLNRLRKLSRESASPSILLAALSFANFLVLTSFLLLKVTPSLCAYKALCYEYFDTYLWIALYGWPTLTVFHTTSTWLTVLLTVHRYIAVCHPLKASEWGSLSKVKLHIFITCIGSILYSVPGYLDYTAVKQVNDWGQEVYVRVLTSLGKDHWYQVLYKQASYYVIIYFVPVLILVVLGALVVRTLTHSEGFRAQKGQAGSEKGKPSSKRSVKDDMTRITIIIVAVNLVTQPWEPVRRLMSENLSMDKSCGKILFYFDEIPSLLAALNCAVNFVVFCLVGSRFRKVCKELCTCSTGKKGGSRGSTTGSGTTGQTSESNV